MLRRPLRCYRGTRHNGFRGRVYRFGDNSSLGFCSFGAPFSPWLKLPSEERSSAESVGYFRLGEGVPHRVKHRDCEDLRPSQAIGFSAGQLRLAVESLDDAR